jgi:hypothetical protein
VASSSAVRRLRWLKLLGGAISTAACLVIAPLEDLNREPSTSADAASDAPDTDSDVPDAPECTTNAECIERNGALPYRCLRGRCRRLTSTQCPLVRGDYEHRNAIFLAAFSFINPVAQGTEDTTANYELAIDELNSVRAGGGLPGATDRRPLALVLCQADDPNESPAERRETALAGLKHVIETLEVPAVIAGFDPEDLLAAFDRYDDTHGVFFFSPIGATSAVANLPDRGLLWHMLGQPADLAGTYVSLLPLYESFVRQRRALSGQEDVKVALVYTDAAFDSELENAADELLRFNGRTLALNENAGKYLEVFLPAAAPPAQIEAAAEKITGFRPQIVISMTGTVFTGRGGILEKIETGWPPPDDDRPFYVLSPLNTDEAGREVARLIKGLLIDELGELEASERFVGVNVAGSEDGVLYNEYLKRLRAKRPGAVAGDENFYDIVYLLAYAIGAAGVEDVVGSDIATSIERVITGTKEFHVGPDDALAIYDELEKAEGRIRLLGALGPPRFNRSAGVRIDSGALYCFEPIPRSDPVVQLQVGYYDRDQEPPLLRASELWSNRGLPCLQELGLPAP